MINDLQCRSFAIAPGSLHLTPWNYVTMVCQRSMEQRIGRSKRAKLLLYESASKLSLKPIYGP